MKKKIVYIFIFLVIATAQLSFLPVIFGAGNVADGVLMAILAWSVIDGFFSFLSWAIFLGLFYDLISYSTIGTHALIFLLVVYFVSFFSRRITLEFRGMGLFLFLAFIVVATLLSHAIIALILAMKMQTLGGYFKSFGSMGSISLQFIYNAILFFLCFLLIRKAKQFFAITE